MASRIPGRFWRGTRATRDSSRYVQCQSYASSSTSNQRPLMPSVQLLLHTNNISASDIKGTGPNGRILKGDVLAHLGHVGHSYPQELSQRLAKLALVDLSYIQAAPPAPQSPSQATNITTPNLSSPATKVFESRLAIDLSPVLKIQQKVENNIGHYLPLSEFIARATKLANLTLPAPSRQPTATQLFDEIVSSAKPSIRTSHGRYVPSIIQLPALRASTSVRSQDILDQLISFVSSRKQSSSKSGSVTLPDGGAINVFSLTTKLDEKTRATVFLQRLKNLLELDPGRLIL